MLLGIMSVNRIVIHHIDYEEAEMTSQTTMASTNDSENVSIFSI